MSERWIAAKSSRAVVGMARSAAAAASRARRNARRSKSAPAAPPTATDARASRGGWAERGEARVAERGPREAPVREERERPRDVAPFFFAFARVVSALDKSLSASAARGD